MKTKTYPLEIPETFHYRIKLRATREGITIKALIEQALKDYLAKSKDAKKDA